MSHLRTLAITSTIVLVLFGQGAVAAQDDAGEPCAESSAAAEASPSASPAASPAASPEASPEASPQAAAAEECVVDIRDLTFMPADIEIAVGTTVTWTNSDTVPHTATATDGTFDSGVFDPGETFSYTFEEAGTFDYTCLIHPEMQGSIVVR